MKIMIYALLITVIYYFQMNRVRLNLFKSGVVDA